MKTILSLTAFIVLGLFTMQSCSTKNGTNTTGFAIYQVKYSHPDFPQADQLDCNYCFEPTKEDLFESPLLTEKHITKFDFEKQQIFLNDAGNAIVQHLDIPLRGLPVALTLNGEILYGFWFWNTISSFGCDWVYTCPAMNFKIEFGLPTDQARGEDPRFNEKLKLYLDAK